MALYYFDFKSGGQTFRDRSGTEYSDLDAAWRDVRSALLDLARCEALAEGCEITVREGVKPLRKARLAYSEEFMDGSAPGLAP